MKGTFFQKPLELTLHVDGQSWKQGDTISGNLNVKNHSSESVSLKDFGVTLGFGASKKIRAKDPEAFAFQGEKLFEGTDEVSAGSELELPFEFTLEKNAPISEKSQGLFMLCGYKNKPFEGGMLELKILPIETITNLFLVFGNMLRFKAKSLKNKKDSIEAIMVVPGTTEYSSVQQLKVLVKIVKDDLDVTFNFKLKKISFEEGHVKSKDEKLKIQKILTPKEYLIYGDAFNQEKVLEILSEVVEEVKVKPFV